MIQHFFLKRKITIYLRVFSFKTVLQEYKLYSQLFSVCLHLIVFLKSHILRHNVEIHGYDSGEEADRRNTIRMLMAW